MAMLRMKLDSKALVQFFRFPPGWGIIYSVWVQSASAA